MTIGNRRIVLLISALLLLAGCATSGADFGEISQQLNEYSGTEIEVRGAAGRGVPVAGTDLYVYQFTQANQTVAVLSTELPERSETRTLSGRVIPFGDEENGDAAVEREIAEYLEAHGVSDSATEAASGQSYGLIRTFTMANSASFFVLEH